MVSRRTYKKPAPRPAQILAARGREHVAADLPHLDRELAVHRTREANV
jgi:hypothetical protein